MSAHSTLSEDQVKQMVEGAFVEGWHRAGGTDGVLAGPNEVEAAWERSEAKRQLELHLAEELCRRLDEDDCA